MFGSIRGETQAREGHKVRVVEILNETRSTPLRNDDLLMLKDLSSKNRDSSGTLVGKLPRVHGFCGESGVS